MTGHSCERQQSCQCDSENDGFPIEDARILDPCGASSLVNMI